MLLRDGEAGLAELVHQGVFVEFLEEAGSQRAEYGQGRADDAFGQEVDRVVGGSFLRVLCVLWFHTFLLAAQGCQVVEAGEGSLLRWRDGHTRNASCPVATSGWRRWCCRMGLAGVRVR